MAVSVALKIVVHSHERVRSKSDLLSYSFATYEYNAYLHFKVLWTVDHTLITYHYLPCFSTCTKLYCLLTEVERCKSLVYVVAQQYLSQTHDLLTVSLAPRTTMLLALL